MKSKPVFKTLIFEIRYASGHLYYDRCGQTIQDIENNLVGWVGGISDLNSGNIQRIDKDYTAAFSNNKFDFTANTVNDDTKSISEDISSVWRIIQANLGLDDFIRVGCRFYYLLSNESLEEGEKRLQDSPLNIKYPESFLKNGSKIKNRHIITVITNGDMEYRIELSNITRSEGMDVASLLRSDPRLLSQKQKEYRIEALKRAKEYSKDPMYAIQLDIDCVQYEPDTVNVAKYILNNEKFIKENYLPMLEEL